MSRKLLHSIFWLLYFVLGVFYKTNNLPLVEAISHTLFVVVASAVLFYVHAHFLVDRFLEKKQMLYFALGSVLIFLTYFFLRKGIEVSSFSTFFDLPAFEERKRINGYLALSIGIIMLLSTVVRLLENRLNREKAVQQMITQQREAELQFLKAQINPHFLFNTLNNIYSLAVVKSDKTPDMVLGLSDLLRYVIYDSQQQEVALSQEVKHVQQYIDLYQMKSESPLNVKFDISGHLTSHKIAPMILIPLVENCFKHSDIETNPDGYINVALHVNAKGLSFKTDNSINDVNTQKDRVGGVGLVNIQKRLALHYPNQYQFVQNENPGNYQVNLSITTSHENL